MQSTQVPVWVSSVLPSSWLEFALAVHEVTRASLASDADMESRSYGVFTKVDLYGKFCSARTQAVVMCLKELASGIDGVCAVDCGKACDLVVSADHLQAIAMKDIALADTEYVASWCKAIEAGNGGDAAGVIAALGKTPEETKPEVAEAEEQTDAVRCGIGLGIRKIVR